MKIAIAQLRSTEDHWENLALVESLSEEAEREGASLICFPENVLYRGRRNKISSDVILKLQSNGHIETSASAFAREVYDLQNRSKITISLGSVLEDSGDRARPFNSHWILRPNKAVLAYQKIHLFSFYQDDVVYRESDQIKGGRDILSFDLDGGTVGLSICYDLRFPELYRVMSLDRGVNIILVPSAFTMETGRAHWHTLLRARAIENLSYVIAAAQWGSHLNEKDQQLWCYGHSLAYDPWGEPLAEGPEQGDSLQFIHFDNSRVSTLRKRLPALQDRVLR